MYKLDTQAAIDADKFSQYLDKSGKYVGKFTRAEKLVSKTKGTHGIGFTFEAQDGGTTRFDVWTMDKDEKKLSGFNAVCAIMTCLSLRDLPESTATIERRDWATNKTEKVQAQVFADLANKPIGLVLRNTEYQKMKDGVLTGEYGWRLELVAPFRAADSFTASEILTKKTKPEKLESIMATLKDKPMKDKPATAQRAPDRGMAPPPALEFAPFDDGSDIPF